MGYFFSWNRNRVAIFRQKNYSMEYGTRRNRRQFRQNSACFAEEKNRGIPFRTIFRWENPWNFAPIHFRKRKTSEFHSKLLLDEKNPRITFQTIFGREKNPQNSVPNYFWMRKNFGIPFRTNSRNRKHSKIHSKPFLQSENTRKKQLLLAAS